MAAGSGRRASGRRLIGRPLLVGALTVGLGASALGYAGAHDLGASSTASAVSAGVTAQTDEPARAASVPSADREGVSVSRDERRTALSGTGVDTAAELAAAAKAKADAESKAKADAAAKAKADREAARRAAVTQAQKDPKAAARVLMAEQGWKSSAQYTCLVNLWTGESDWRWSAENASSGAYGIAQSLPARKMARFGRDYRTNPQTQIRWGLWYIKMSYGDPCNAWSTWQSRSPHWY